MVFLSSLVVAIAGGVLYATSGRDVKPFLKSISDSVPDISFSGGTLQTALKEPLVIQKGRLTFAVYPLPQEESIRQFLMTLGPGSSFVLAGKALYVKDGANTVVFPLSEVSRLFGLTKITGRDFESMRRTLDVLMVPVLVFFFFFFFIWSVMQVVYFSAFGYLYSRFAELRVPPQGRTGISEIFKMNVYASTPGALMMAAIFIAAQFFALNISADQAQTVHMLLSASFFLGGYYAYRSLQPPPEDESEDWADD